MGNSLKVIDPPGILTGLFSYPGSGNTWLRYLIQKTTGYVTGVDGNVTKFATTKDDIDKFIAKTNKFFNEGFPGELLLDGSAIVIKTHLMVYGHQTYVQMVIQVFVQLLYFNT